MDKAIGTLGDYLRHCGGPIPRDECRRIFYQLLAGLAELNRLAIVHVSSSCPAIALSIVVLHAQQNSTLHRDHTAHSGPRHPSE